MRGLAVPVVVAAALCLAPAPAVAADVTVIGPRGGASTTVSLESLSSSFDVDADYELRDAGGPLESRRVRGISLAALLAAVDADPVYGGVEVLRGNGAPVLVSKAQIVAGSPSPVIYADGDHAVFLRPSYAAADANAADVVAGAPLVLRQTGGSPLQVEARVSAVRAGVGKTLRFMATATGAAAGESYLFKWNFDDGSTATGAEVSHSFARRGRYDVLVTVSAGGSTRSDPDVVSVQVGRAVKSEKARKGGGTNDAANAPDSGASDGAAGQGAAAGGAGRAKHAAERRQRRRKRAGTASAAPAVPPVTGRLLDQVGVRNERQPAVAARSGRAEPPGRTASGVPRAAVGTAGALALLGIGAALELGAPARVRRRLATSRA